MKMRRIRLTILVAVLLLSLMAGCLHYARVRYQDRQLYRIAEDIIEETLRNDPLPVSAQDPEATVHIKVVWMFFRLSFGELTGRIVLLVTPRPYAPDQRLREEVCAYRREGGEWKPVESFREFLKSCD